MIKLEATAESEENLRRAFQRMESAIVGVSSKAHEWGWIAYADVVTEIFTSYGGSINEDWAPLSKRTIEEREELGYGRDPILKRSGDLFESLTDYTMGPQTVTVERVGQNPEYLQGGNVYGLLRQGADVKFQVATLDERFLRLHYGTYFTSGIEGMMQEKFLGDSDHAPIPGRRMVPGEAHQDLVGEQIDSFLVEEIEGHLNG